MLRHNSQVHRLLVTLWPQSHQLWRGIRDSMCVDVAIWLACILDDGESPREDT